MTGTQSPTACRHEALDGLRGIAAQVVFLYHLVTLAFPGCPPLVTSGLAWAARLAVVAFFVLSGFVIALSLQGLVQQRGRAFLLPYAVHRWARIVPPLVFAVALTFAVGIGARSLGLSLPGPASQDFVLDFAALLRGLTLTFGAGDATFVIDRPLWSLRQEVWAYVLAALAAVALTRGGLARAGALALIVGLVALTWNRFFYVQSFVMFAAGAGAYALRNNTGVRRVAGSPWTALGTAVLVLLPLAASGASPDFLTRISEDRALLAYQGALGLPIALLILAIATGEERVSRGLARCRSIGAYSYTLYVTHNPVLVFLYAVLDAVGAAGGLWTTALGLLAAVVACQGMAYGAARVLERPRRFRALAWRALTWVGARPEPALAGAPSPTRA